jgi:hypothetical protein
MKKSKSEKTFDLEYVQFIEPEKAHARSVADDWIMYFENLPLSRQARETFLGNIEAEIKKAIETGDAGFFRRFANYIEKPKDACPIRNWLLWLHIESEIRFTQAELVKGAKQVGFFKNSDDDMELSSCSN